MRRLHYFLSPHYHGRVRHKLGRACDLGHVYGPRETWASPFSLSRDAVELVVLPDADLRRTENYSERNGRQDIWRILHETLDEVEEICFFGRRAFDSLAIAPTPVRAAITSALKNTLTVAIICSNHASPRIYCCSCSAAGCSVCCSPCSAARWASAACWAAAALAP